MSRPALCADVGSTFTKVALVDLDTGELLATAGHRTTTDSDVLRGLDAAAAAAGATRAMPWYVCSSAGGGLRLAVVGYERLVTAQAGHRVGLSAGARVVHVAAGRLDHEAVAALRATRPDVVLLVGGTDGGDVDVLHHNATRLARARLRVPVVVAGNVDARPLVAAVLADAGVPVTVTANVLPRIGTLHPQPARVAIREMFLRHVIGGKCLSRGPRFPRLVRAATPDAVLTAVELLAAHQGGDLLVVDIGGATTDVYSALTPPSEPETDVAGTLWRARTVEGDLGVRWSASGVVAAAAAEGLLAPAEAETLGPVSDQRVTSTGMLAETPEQRRHDLRLATLAATVALRRHARGEPVTAGGPRRGGHDLRAVRLAVGSGGVLRHAPPEAAEAVLRTTLDDHAGGWPLPRAPRMVVDRHYVLAAAGLLAPEHPGAALGLLTARLLSAEG